MLVKYFYYVICCLHAVFARFKTKLYSKYFRFLATTTRTGIEIVNPCIPFWHFAKTYPRAISRNFLRSS